MSRTTEPLQLLLVGDFTADGIEGRIHDAAFDEASARAKQLPLTAKSTTLATRSPELGSSEMLAALMAAYPAVELVLDASGVVLYADSAAKERLADGESLVGQRLQLQARLEDASVSFQGRRGVRKCPVATTRVEWPKVPHGEMQTPPEPATIANAIPLSQPSPRANVGRDETVLLVDDDAAVRRATARVLRGLGYLVLEASNGEEACRALCEQSRGVSAVITDMLMPGMTGLDVFDFVYARYPELPVLVVTGESEEPERRRGLRLLHKPFHPKELATTLRDVLDS